jgi:hypothetical protein
MRVGVGKLKAGCALALVAALISLPTVSIAADDTRVIKETCGDESHIAEGNIGEDLKKYRSRFFCDLAVLTVFGNDAKHVLVQFLESKSNHGRPLAYAGTLLDADIMTVDHVFLEPGIPTPVVDGYCKFFFTSKIMEKNISDIACGAKIDESGRRTVPIVNFHANQSTRTMGSANGRHSE